MNINNKSTQSIQNLTIADLEVLIEAIVEKSLKQKILEVETNSETELLKTFGTWQDSQSAEKIIEQIYSSRNSNLSLS